MPVLDVGENKVIPTLSGLYHCMLLGLSIICSRNYLASCGMYTYILMCVCMYVYVYIYILIFVSLGVSKVEFCSFIVVVGR
jgi:hypothetical protein